MPKDKLHKIYYTYITYKKTHNKLLTIQYYNIASRVTQSNSVYVSVLKIPIVHADSVSKSLRQNFFFALAAIVSAGQNIIFRDNNGYRDSAHQSQNEHNFPTFSLELELLNEAEKGENNGKGDSASAPSRLASLPEVQG